MKKNKSIVALIALAIVGLVGGTFAYFTMSETFENVFETKKFHAEMSEVFESPKDWMPGATTEKMVLVENTGDVDVAVRVSYTESWVSEQGDILSLKQGDNDAAQINFTNQDEWKKQDVEEDGETKTYYVYNKILAQNEKSSTFIDSVRFNPAITATYECAISTDIVEGKTITKKTCDSTGHGYDGATYTLKITVEVIQADVAIAQWKLANNFFDTDVA